MSKKDVVARVLSSAGILAGMEKFLDKPSLIVLAYHRIGSSSENLFDNQLYSASEEQFEAQVSYLKKHFNLVNANTMDLVDGPNAMITFDDGYRDNYINAFRIIKNLGATATFFITTGYINNPKLSWWDHIAYVITQSQLTSFELDYQAPIQVHRSNRGQAIKKILDAIKHLENINYDYLLSHIEERAQVVVDSEKLGTELFMDWNQIREMNDSGMAIGSHTHTHQILKQLDNEEQEKELFQSRTVLQEELGCEIYSLAYPVGNRDSFNIETKEIALKVGYKLGFSCYGGTGAEDKMDIKRYSVDTKVSFPMFRARALMTHLFGHSIC